MPLGGTYHISSEAAYGPAFARSLKVSEYATRCPAWRLMPLGGTYRISLEIEYLSGFRALPDK